MDADELGWNRRLREQGDVGLRVLISGKEPFSGVSVADLVLRVRHELIHRLPEVCLLRGPYLHTKPVTNGVIR